MITSGLPRPIIESDSIYVRIPKKVERTISATYFHIINKIIEKHQFFLNCTYPKIFDLFFVKKDRRRKFQNHITKSLHTVLMLTVENNKLRILFVPYIK